VGAVQKAEETFYVRVQDITSCPVGMKGSEKFGDTGRRFTRLGHGGMNKKHARLKGNAQGFTCRLMNHSTACGRRHFFFGEILFRHSHSQSTPL
jgi:hypothetical protein